MEGRPEWFVAVYLIAQIVLPLLAVAVRLAGGPQSLRFGWQMFSTVA